MADLTSLVHQLKRERSRLASQLDNISKALVALGGSRGITRRLDPATHLVASVPALA